MSQSKQLWDLLRDLLGLDDGKVSGSQASGTPDKTLREELTACNDDLVAVATELAERHERADAAQLKLAAALAEALEHEQVGETDRASAVRAQIPSFDAQRDAAVASLEVARSRHGLLARRRNELLRALRDEQDIAGARPAAAADAAAVLPQAGAGDPEPARLKSALEGLASTPHVLEQTRRCLDQLDGLQRAEASLRLVLSRKLVPGELTHQRYIRTAQMVTTAVYAGLADAIDVVRLLVDLDPQDIGRALERAEPASVRALKDRLALRAAHTARLESLMSRGDEALTALLAAAAAVAELPGAGGAAQGDFDIILEDLEVLTQRAQLYR